MKIVIIKYNAGNVQSVMFALDRLGVEYEWSNDWETIQKADKIIFPGVGEASTAMSYLKEYQLDTLIPTLKQPFLGTCIGMQLMCNFSEENNTKCMGIFDVSVKKFQSNTHKIPHVGWNTIHSFNSLILDSIPENEYFYFVHSYFVPVMEYTKATCEYVHPFSAILQKENFFAAQFHAEISGKIGEKIIENFVKLC